MLAEYGDLVLHAGLALAAALREDEVAPVVDLGLVVVLDLLGALDLLLLGQRLKVRRGLLLLLARRGLALLGRRLGGRLHEGSLSLGRVVVVVATAVVLALALALVVVVVVVVVDAARLLDLCQFGLVLGHLLLEVLLHAVERLGVGLGHLLDGLPTQGW